MSEHQLATTPFKPVLLDLLSQAWHDQDVFLQALSESERTASGTTIFWSAKDHIVHATFWQRQMALKLQAALRGETPPAPTMPFEEFNRQVFEERRQSPWSEVLLEVEQTRNTLINHMQQLSEEDLVAFQRFAWMRDGEPLCSAIVDNYYEHTLTHLAQYHFERQNLPEAVQLYESWTARVVQADAPAIVQGQLLYNLACFYATHAQLEKASVSIQQALLLYPRFKKLALSDSDLVALHDQFV